MSSVVHVINHLGWGGAENLVRGMARHLRDRGWEVMICALGEPVHEPGGEARCLRARGVWDAAGFMRLRRLLCELRPQVVHLHLLWAELWGVAAARAAGARAVITGHCTYDARETSPLARLWSRAAVGGAAATIAISRSVARYRLERCGDRAHRIHIIHNGVDTDAGPDRPASPAGRRHLGLPADAPVIGAVARLHRVKGLETFLGAAALLARRRPQARFLIVGGGPQEQELRELASSLGLAGRVVFTGEVCFSRVRELLAEMDVFVLPSTREGLGIALIEAMAAGLPTVASECEGIAEVVQEGRSGLLFPPGDVRALAGKVDALLGDAAWAERLGTGARRRACQEFSLGGMVSKVEAVYRAAMGAIPGGRAASCYTTP